MSTGFKVFLCILFGFFGLVFLQSYFIRMPEMQYRVKTSRAKSDMRNLAVSINQYYIDNQQLPEPERSLPDFKKTADREKINGIKLTFVPQHIKGEFEAELRDVFSIKKELPYAYYHDKEGFVLFSPGADEKYQLTPEIFSQLKQSHVTADVANVTYDPTNGSYSYGDVYRYVELK